jgi:hypothetical protein
MGIGEIFLIFRRRSPETVVEKEKPPEKGGLG